MIFTQSLIIFGPKMEPAHYGDRNVNYVHCSKRRLYWDSHELTKYILRAESGAFLTPKHNWRNSALCWRCNIIRAGIFRFQHSTKCHSTCAATLKLRKLQEKETFFWSANIKLPKEKHNPSAS